MKSLGYVLSIILMAASSATMLEMKKNCTSLEKLLTVHSCEDLLKWKTLLPEDADCIDAIIISKDVYNIGKHYACLNFTAQYCNSVSEYRECSDCFLKAFEDFWNQNICLLYYKYHVYEVMDCLEQYVNRDFVWSRGVIFDELQKSVNVTRGKYSTCEGVFTPKEIPKSKTVDFPVYLILQPEIYDIFFDVYLSIFLEAFEVKKVSAPIGVTCQHIVNTKLLSNYKILTDTEIKEAPMKVKESYLTLRSSMCAGSVYFRTCTACFTEADSLFLFHIYNTDLKLSSMRKDFLDIHNMLRNCIRTHTSIMYSSLESLMDKSEGWYVDFGKCWSGRYRKYQKIIRSNKRPIVGIGENEAVIKSVAANYFAFKIYQEIQSNKTQLECSRLRLSHVLCVAARSITAVTQHGDYWVIMTEDKQLQYLAMDIGMCVYQ